MFVLGSLDPNEKEVDTGDDELLIVYTVSFENEGSASARLVVVDDELDLSKHDPESFRLDPLQRRILVFDDDPVDA